MEKLLLFQIGKKQFGMNLSLIRSIYKTDAFFEGQAEKRYSDEMVQASDNGLVQASDLNQQRVSDLNQQRDGSSLQLVGSSLRLEPTTRLRLEPTTLFIDGKEIPLYDLSLLFSEGSAVSDSDGKRIMLIDIQGHFIAVKADRIENVVSVAGDRIEPLPPVFGNPSLICFPRVLKHADTLILLLDIEGIERSKISHVSGKTSKVLKTSEVSEKVSENELNLISSAILKSIKDLTENIKPEEMETLLTRIVQEEIIADIIIRHLKKIIERAVFLEIKRIKKELNLRS